MTQLCFHFHVGPPMKPRHHSILIIVSFSLNKKSLETNIETNVEANESKNNQNIFVSRRFPDFSHSFFRVSYQFFSQRSRLIQIACHMLFEFGASKLNFIFVVLVHINQLLYGVRVYIR